MGAGIAKDTDMTMPTHNKSAPLTLSSLIFEFKRTRVRYLVNLTNILPLYHALCSQVHQYLTLTAVVAMLPEVDTLPGPQ